MESLTATAETVSIGAGRLRRRERRRNDMLDWLAYRRELTGRIGQFAKLAPGTVQGYQALSKAGAAAGHLDAKTRELIALAVSVTTRCDGCIAVHAAEALEQGATKDEIAEALGVAVALNAGAAMVYSARTLDAVDAYTAGAATPAA
jgi:AhpD family alkylhydroperoxidase